MVQTTDDPIEKRSRSELAGEALKVLAAFEVVGVGVPALLPDALPVVLPDVLPDCELVAEPEVVVTETLAALEVEARLIPFPILDRVVQEDDEGIGWADGVTGSP